MEPVHSEGGGGGREGGYRHVLRRITPMVAGVGEHFAGDERLPFGELASSDD